MATSKVTKVPKSAPTRLFDLDAKCCASGASTMGEDAGECCAGPERPKAVGKGGAQALAMVARGTGQRAMESAYLERRITDDKGSPIVKELLDRQRAPTQRVDGGTTTCRESARG